MTNKLEEFASFFVNKECIVTLIHDGALNNSRKKIMENFAAQMKTNCALYKGSLAAAGPLKDVSTKRILAICKSLSKISSKVRIIMMLIQISLSIILICIPQIRKES